MTEFRLSVSGAHNVRLSEGTSLARQYSMPEVSNAETLHPMLADQIGRTVRDQLAFVGAAGVASGALAALRGAGLIKAVAVGVGGLLTAAIGGGLIRWGWDRVNPSPTKTEGAGVPPTTAPTTPEPIRVMTFNIRGGLGRENRYDPERLDRMAEAIKRHNPDVLMLQEVDRFSMLNNFGDVLNQLAMRLDPDGAVATNPSTTITGKTQSTAIFTFNGFDIDNAQTLRAQAPAGEGPVARAAGTLGDVLRWDRLPDWLELNSDSGKLIRYAPRNATDTLITTPDGNIVRALSTHLDGKPYGPNAQRAQVLPIARALGEWRGPTLIGGDFNFASAGEKGNSERRAFGRNGLKDVFIQAGIPPDNPERVTYPGLSEFGTIDRIYSSEHLTTQRVHVSRKDPELSDHRPIIADLTLGGAPSD